MDLITYSITLMVIMLFGAVSKVSLDQFYTRLNYRKIEEGIDHLTYDQIETLEPIYKDVMNNFLTEKLTIKFDNKTKVPKLKRLDTTELGFTAKIDISGVCGFKKIDEEMDYLKQLFRAHEVDITNYRGYAHIYCVLKELKQLLRPELNLNNTQICFGYDQYGEPIIIDMSVTPHIGIVGLSKSGKTTAIEHGLLNMKDIDISLVNAFDHDYTKLGDVPRYNEQKEILDYLTHLLEEGYREIPLIVVIDEYNVLSHIKANPKEKTIDQAIQDLLSQARHFNIYVICIMQLGNKEDCKFKNLFNVRIVFRTIDDATIKAFLGCTTDIKALDNYKFLIYHSSLQRGTAYKVV